MGCTGSKAQLSHHQGLQGNLVKDERRKMETAYDIEQVVMAKGTSTQIKKAQSKVYEYTKTKRSKGVAIKLYDGASSLPIDLKEEANILSKCDHSNIVKLYEVTKMNGKTSLVLELCTGGTLQSRLPYKEARVVEIMRQIVSAVAYLHHNNIVHRDIELTNIMFEDEEPNSCIKLIDFGCATELDTPKDRPGTFKFLTEKTGSIHVMAPEVIHGRYGPKCDVWSIGVVAYMLLMEGKKPFEGNSVTEYENMITKSRMTFGASWNFSNEAKKFILECTTSSPASRLSSAQALNHAWLQESTNKRKYIPNELAVSLALFQRATHLKRVALNALAMKSTGSRYRELFHRLDIGKTGYLTKDEFTNGFVNSGLSKDELQDAFEKLDVNCNNRIMYTEFLAITIEVEGELDDGRLREAFDLLDTDHSSFITKKNLIKILGDSPQIRKSVASLKENEKVSFEAFSDLFQQGHSLQRTIEVIDERNAQASEPNKSKTPRKSMNGQLSAVNEGDDAEEEEEEEEEA